MTDTICEFGPWISVDIN